MSHREYYLGEARHLLAGGMTAEYVCEVLNKTPSSLRKLAERDGDNMLTNKFAQLERMMKKGLNYDDGE